jgi:DNA-binding NtrC family response regulator
LLVEDEDAIRELSRRILSRHGYLVLDAAGPLGALERFDRHAESIDLVLTDVVMPQMNGKVLVERMRQRRRDIKVLYMSGYPEDMTANQGKLAEGIDLLEKPFDEEGLLRAVKRSLLKNVESGSATGIEAEAATAA